MPGQEICKRFVAAFPIQMHAAIKPKEENKFLAETFLCVEKKKTEHFGSLAEGK